MSAPGRAVVEGEEPPCQRGHRWQLITFDQRRCQGCERVDELVVTKPVETTEAFQQAQKERV